MVQLKVALDPNANPRIQMFQFLNGTIKRSLGLWESFFSKVFQFLNGTIKSYLFSKRKQYQRFVSIPKWYN